MDYLIALELHKSISALLKYFTDLFLSEKFTASEILKYSHRSRSFKIGTLKIK